MTGAHANRGSLTQEPDRFSDAAWDLLLSGQDVARRWRHDQLDVEHLIQVLFTDPAFRRWVEPLPIQSDALLDRLEDVLADQPSARVDDLFIGEDLEQLLDSADGIRARWGERLIDVPPLMVAMGADPRIGAELFSAVGLPADRLERLLRSPEPTPTPMASVAPVPAAPVSAAPVATPDIPDTPVLEQEPTALESYGRDLTAAAAAGRSPAASPARTTRGDKDLRR